jgi:ADP-dependent NAD(P)H-hydrate dehydratase / NAD(P)H-hydrate epimerase
MALMKLYSSQQVRAIEKRTFGSDFGISPETAMSFAGKAVSDFIISKFTPEIKIAVVCGHGNNGGDGFCAAVFLSAKGYSCDLFFDLEKYDLLSKESRSYLDICTNIKIVRPVPQTLDGYSCVVDAVLGIGINGKPRHDTAELIKLINSSKAYIVSADIPSGLSAKGTVIDGTIVKADATITMGVHKLNCMIFPGKRFCGEIHVADIGFPASIVDASEYAAELADSELFSNMQIVSDDEENKYRKGHILVVGGFEGMEGAALLSARAAFETGAGLVTVATTETSRNIIAGKIPEVMTVSIPSDSSDTQKFFSNYIDAKNVRVVVLGPGLGRGKQSEAVYSSCLRALKDKSIRTVLDGDALHFLAHDEEKIKLSDTVITPHTGEGARLLGIESAEVVSDLYSNSLALAKKFGCVCILKGASTVISSGESVRVLPGGNSGLATAGSGDVLAGITSALLLKQEISIFEASSLSACVHFQAGLHAIKSQNELPVLRASDIILHIRECLTLLRTQPLRK